MRRLALFTWLSVLLASGASWGLPRVYHRAVVTADGVRLALYRYQSSIEDAALPPVFLMPDLGMTRASLDGPRGLATFLAEHGRDVFLLEPRGHGASGGGADMSLTAIVTRDLPAAFDAMGQLRPGRADVVAYGYAGALELGAAGRELRGRVGRIVALATPVAPMASSPYAERLLAGGGRLRQTAADPEQRAQLEHLFANRGQLPAGALEALEARGVQDLPPRMAQDFLEWLRRGDLPLGPASLQARLADLDRPVLAIIGLADNWSDPEFASPLRSLAPRAPVRFQLLSRLDGLVEDYSHWSLIRGRACVQEVFEPALAFLAEPPGRTVAR